jgi:prepilin-type processing-associated H-X9-DG protein
VELLVVVAIIAILAGILLPVFAKARLHSYKAVCASNQRQLVQANLMYAGDCGRYVPAAQDLWETNRLRWFGVRGPDGRFVPRDGPLVPYLRDGGALRRCLSFPPPAEGFSLGTGGYVYNYVAVGSDVWGLGFLPEAFHSSRREGGIARPSEVVMFADGAIDAGKAGVVEYGLLEPPPPILERMGSPYVMDPSIHFRHSGHAILGFVDGHVAARRMALSVDSSPVYGSANPRAHSIGWVGPVDGDSPYDPD